MSLADAAADLEAEFGSASVADWQRQVADEDVRHSAAGVTTVEAVHWINRPTFQQVVQIGAPASFKCYKTANAPRLPASTVMLADPFETKNTVVRKPALFCNPVDAAGSGITDETAHLTCHKIRNAGGQPPFTRRDVQVSNRFGAHTLTLVKPTTLCAPSAAGGVPLARPLDHFKCYKVSRPVPRPTRQTVQLVDVFESKATTLYKPRAVCTAVDNNGAGLTDPAARLVCYQIKDAPGQAPFARRDVDVSEPFGDMTLSLTKSRLVCVPSFVE
jgi:hypothetical protein